MTETGWDEQLGLVVRQGAQVWDAGGMLLQFKFTELMDDFVRVPLRASEGEEKIGVQVNGSIWGRLYPTDPNPDADE